MKAIEIVYDNNLRIGTFIDKKYKSLSKEERNDLYQNIQKKVSKKDNNRKLSSLIISLLMLVAAIALFFILLFKVIDMSWLTYSFILAGLVIFWALFYFLFGFIFYSKLVINYSFKTNKDVVNYAASNYKKYVEKYNEYLNINEFRSIDKKNTLIPFCLYMPKKLKDVIFNGKICCNVPYYYFSYKSKRIIFLPGITIIVDKNNSKVISNENIEVNLSDKIYTLYENNKEIISISNSNDFPINFFYFKYEQNK